MLLLIVTMECSSESNSVTGKRSERKQHTGNYADWIITRNLQDGETELPEVKFNQSTMWLFMGQQERGEDKGRLHYQAFVQFHDKKTLQQAKAAIGWGTSTHLEKRFGTVDQACEYVSKDETRVEGTEFKHGLVQPRIAGMNPRKYYLMQKMNQGCSLRSLRDDKIAQDLVFDKLPASECFNGSPSTKRKIFIIWGEGGCGKSVLAKAICKKLGLLYNYTTYVKDDPDWWQEYQGEEVVYIPEFEGLMRYAEFKKLIDNSEYKLRVKGGHATSNIKYIICCSNKHPEQWYPNKAFLAGHLKPEYKRRIKYSWNMQRREEQIAFGREILQIIHDLEEATGSQDEDQVIHDLCNEL